MTFEEFFKKKKIDLPALEKAEGALFSEFKVHFEKMGEKSFDHTKKYWFNKLRGQFPLPPEVKVEKVRIENPLAEQTIIETLEEVAQKASVPKPGFTPRFMAASAPKPAEENTAPSAVPEQPVTTPQPGFTPRFKAAALPKAIEENTEPKETIDQPETKEPASAPPKPAGFTPRFKAATPPTKVDPVAKQPSEDDKSEKTDLPEQPEEPAPPQPYKPRFKPGMLPKKPEE